MVKTWRIAAVIGTVIYGAGAFASDDSLDKSAYRHAHAAGWEIACDNLRHCSLIASGKGNNALAARIDIARPQISAWPPPHKIEPEIRLFVWMGRGEPLVKFTVTAQSKAGPIAIASITGKADDRGLYSILLDRKQSAALFSLLMADPRLSVVAHGRKERRFTEILPALEPALNKTKDFRLLTRVNMPMVRNTQGAIAIDRKPGADVLGFVYKRCDDTEDKPEMIRQGWRLPGKSFLWEIFCAANGSEESRIYVLQEEGKQPSLLPLVFGDARFGQEGLIGATFDPKALTITSVVPGGYSCGGGNKRIFLMQGIEGFVLSEYRKLETCLPLGEYDWPYLWRADLK